MKITDLLGPLAVSATIVGSTVAEPCLSTFSPATITPSSPLTRCELRNSSVGLPFEICTQNGYQIGAQPQFPDNNPGQITVGSNPNNDGGPCTPGLQYSDVLMPGYIPVTDPKVCGGNSQDDPNVAMYAPNDHTSSKKIRGTYSIFHSNDLPPNVEAASCYEITEFKAPDPICFNVTAYPEALLVGPKEQPPLCTPNALRSATLQYTDTQRPQVELRRQGSQAQGSGRLSRGEHVPQIATDPRSVNGRFPTTPQNANNAAMIR